MAKQRVPVLLVVMSILVIIVGAVIFLIGLLGALAGTVLTAAGASMGSGLLVGLGLTFAIVSLVGGSLELIAGICSVQGKHLVFCLVIAIGLVILSVIFLFSYSADASAGESGISIVSIVAVLIFHVLYFISVLLGRRRLGAAGRA